MIQHKYPDKFHTKSTAVFRLFDASGKLVLEESKTFRRGLKFGRRLRKAQKKHLISLYRDGVMKAEIECEQLRTTFEFRDGDLICAGIEF